MEKLTLRQLLEAVGGTLLGEFADLDATAADVCTDSRNITPGCLFIPLEGERFDGHSFINAALEAGAAGCLTAREREGYLPGKFYIKVRSTQRALWELARYYKGLFPIPFIAVTGSVGKTTTKDMVAAVLGARFRVHKTEGNFNNDIGVPLTLLKLEKGHEVCVVELGMDHAGEIDNLARLVEPDMALITNIGDAHIENLGSRENIFKAKCEIFPHLKRDGLAVLNGDDPMLATLKGTLSQRAVFVGGGEGLDYTARDLNSGDGGHLTCRVKTPRGQFEADIPALGSHMIYPTLMAAAVGEALGMAPDEIVRGIGAFLPTKMRMNIVRCKGDIVILNDAYNANPQSMRAAVEVLSSMEGDYKIAVLGDMFELGPLAPALHAGVGEHLGRSKVDCLVAVGNLARHIYDAASPHMAQAHYCKSKEEAKPLLADLLRPQATVLVKASRGMAFEELAEYLKSITKDA